MQSLTQAAQKTSLLLQYGVLNGNEVIAWVDSAIVEMTSPPEPLLELSMTQPDKTADIMSHLARLASEADLWAALRSAIPPIRGFIILHPDRAEIISNYLFHTASRFGFQDLPKDLHFIYQFDDAFEMARSGISGDSQAVYRDFVNELSKFRSTN